VRVLCLFSLLFGLWLLTMLDDASGNADRDTAGRHIAAHDGIRHTRTSIAFRAYSRHDIEAVFSIGS